MNICFVDKTNFSYDANSLYSKELRGAESVIINLSSALANLGNQVTVINNCYKSKSINGVNWIDIKSINQIYKYDLVIANGDCRLFKYAASKKNILFSHSLQSIEKFLRKKQLLSYLKYKPKICFLSNYHKKNRSKFLHMFGSINLEWAVDELFTKSSVSDQTNSNQAIFTSRPDRNLELLLKLWTSSIIKRNKNLKLLVTENNFKINDKSIIKRKLGNQTELFEDLQKSKLCLLPGHKAELYCLAAEEAKELCIPIVTFGIGSLSERVEHNITGFIANNENEFIEYTLELFSNEILWNKIRTNLIKIKGLKNWTNVANNLIDQINEI